MSESHAVTRRVSATLGNRLRALRHARGKSQEAVAHAAGITRNHYQLLEAGLSSSGSPANPRLHTLLALAQTLDTPVAELVSGLDTLEPSSPLEGED